MSEQAPDRFWSGIQMTKVAAGTLAAVSAAVIGSFLGVAGTLAGAAIASIVGSIGTEIYQRSLDRGAKKLQTLAPTFIKAPAAVGTPAVPAATEDDSPSQTVPEEVRETPTEAARPRPLPWKRIGLAAALLFVLALASLSVVELLAGRSVASMVGTSDARSTVSSVVGDDGGAQTRQEDPAPATSESAPAEDPTEQPADEPTETPTADPSTEPTTEPSTEPTTEAPDTEAPATDAPEQEPPADVQENQQQPPQE